MLLDLYGNPYAKEAPPAFSTRDPLIASIRNASFANYTNDGYRSLNGSYLPQLIPHHQMLYYSYWMWHTNQLYGGIIEKKSAVILGNGFEFESASGDEKVNERIDKFYRKDKINNFQWWIRTYLNWLYVFGELCFEVNVKKPSNDVEVAHIGGYEISNTIVDPNNRMTVIGVVLASSPKDILTTVIDPRKTDEELFRPETVALRKSFTVGGEKRFCYFFPINPRFEQYGSFEGPSLRGTPELFSGIDGCISSEEIIFAMNRRADVASRIINDLTIEGAGQDEIDAFNAKTDLPDENTWWAHNEKMTMQILTPDLRSSEHETQHRTTRNATISGKGSGIPPTWVGDGENANRASATEMPFCTLKDLLDEQKQAIEIFRNLVDYQLAQDNVPADDLVAIAPTISESDFEMLTRAFATLTSSLVVGQQQRYITEEEARQLYRTNVEDFGKELGEYEPTEIDESKKSSQERVTEDYKEEDNATRTPEEETGS
jgi:hypothetical protein